MTDFAATINAAYATEGAAIDLGRGVHEGVLVREAEVKIPLATMNRHGLVAGATGTGKTKSLQVISEQLSRAGVPVLVADVKGDVSGLAVPAEAGGAGEKRMADLGLPFAPEAFPVQFLSLGGLGPGAPIRATVTDFGPQLLAKVLGANETQEASLALVFHYADEKGLLLLDLGDLRALLTYLDSDAGKAELEGIGGLSSATVGVLLRSLVGLETGGGTEFFGEPQLDVADLMAVAPDGRGVVSCVELAAVQARPKAGDERSEAGPALWSTALMWLVAELFETLPEAGDLPAPVETLLTSVGIGEAAVTLLSEKGIPTPVVHTRLIGPSSSMDPAPDVEAAAKASPLWATYGERVDAHSAREILAGRMEHVPLPRSLPDARRAPAPRESGADAIGGFLRSREGKALQRKITRGIFGMLRKRI